METAERVLQAAEPLNSGSEHERGELGEFGVLLNGAWLKTGVIANIPSPYDNRIVGRAHLAQPEQLRSAIASVTEGFTVTRKLPSWKRAEILNRISSAIAGRREEFARTIALEAGKPIRTARIEVDRASFTFQIAAEEAKRIYGEIVPLDWAPGMDGRTAVIQHVPLGPILGITPFNYPLNLVAHKVAPALAAGDSIIIRPATQTPISALKLGQIVLDAGWPLNGIAVVPSSSQDAGILVQDDRLKLLTFTGSPTVGWMLKGRAGRKRVTLELGGNAGVIVHEDADIAYAAERVAWGGFSYAGQSCISVQRVYVHASIYDSFLEHLLPRVNALKVGDPMDEATDVGPLIHRGEAERVEEWIREAVDAGARVLTGGTREGAVWRPTILASVRDDLRVSCQEVFAPVMVIYPYGDISEAIRAVDHSDFGLQAGIFTNNLNVIQSAFEEIEVGGLMVNDVSSFRIDHMPYGGVKQSGAGREGLRYAIQEMSELKLLTVNRRT